MCSTCAWVFFSGESLENMALFMLSLWFYIILCILVSTNTP